MFVVTIFSLFLDIITVENQSKVSKNIFAELNKQYEKLVHCRKQNFLSKIISKSIKDVDSRVISMNLTLLPHQVLILPDSYYLAMDKSILVNQNITILTNDQLR